MLVHYKLMVVEMGDTLPSKVGGKDIVWSYW
nr:MAG TPA: hypothetical protein [Caudoviricetes sp.]